MVRTEWHVVDKYHMHAHINYSLQSVEESVNTLTLKEQCVCILDCVWSRRRCAMCYMRTHIHFDTCNFNVWVWWSIY
jgi:hypothetical protein